MDQPQQPAPASPPTCAAVNRSTSHNVPAAFRPCTRAALTPGNQGQVVKSNTKERKSFQFRRAKMGSIIDLP